MARDEFLSYSKDPTLWLNSVGITLFFIAMIIIIGYYFPEFYLSHGTILLVPLYLTINYNHKLRKNAWKTAFINGLIAAFIVGIINMVIGYFYGKTPNYMYICEAPIADNPLLLTTQWPYYFLMLIFFMLIHVIGIFYIYKLIGRVKK